MQMSSILRSVLQSNDNVCGRSNENVMHDSVPVTVSLNSNITKVTTNTQITLTATELDDKKTFMK